MGPAAALARGARIAPRERSCGSASLRPCTSGGYPPPLRGGYPTEGFGGLRAPKRINSGIVNAPRLRGGFTMIELMGVVIVLGLMASLVMVSWESILPRTELNSAVRELASQLSTTRSDAVARSLPFTIEYYFEASDSHPRGYRVVTPFRKDGSGVAAREEERLALEWHTLPDSVYFKRIRINGIDSTEGMVLVRFDPTGSASDHSVVLEQKPYGHLYTLEVLALTGDVRFHEGEFAREYPRDNEFK
jgi:Tfp pilus assembly protein FimT